MTSAAELLRADFAIRTKVVSEARPVVEPVGLRPKLGEVPSEAVGLLRLPLSSRDLISLQLSRQAT